MRVHVPSLYISIVGPGGIAVLRGPPCGLSNVVFVMLTVFTKLEMSFRVVLSFVFSLLNVHAVVARN